jgi:protein SCO1
MKPNYSPWIFVVAVVMLPVAVFGVVQWAEARYQQLPVLGPAAHRIDHFQLTDQHRKTVGLETWENKVVVAHVFFTYCPAICPKMIYQLKRVQAYAEVPNLLIASFTVDPDRDSSERLQQYAAEWGIENNWQLLTGDKRQLYRLARKSLMVTATDGDGGPDDFIHSELLVLIDTNKRIRGFYEGTEEASVNRLVQDIRKLSRN